MSQLPSPGTLLSIPSYGSWRKHQDTAFCEVMDWYSSNLRYMGLSAATGSGKSLIALLTAKMTGARTVILTATKGLQEQYSQVGAQLGLVSVKGQNNFMCQLVPGLRADEGPCQESLNCEYRSNGCRYREQLNKALGSSLIVTNYSYYLAQTQFSSGLGDIDLLIADEAHLAFSAVENFMQIHLSRQETESLVSNFPVVNRTGHSGKHGRQPTSIPSPKPQRTWKRRSSQHVRMVILYRPPSPVFYVLTEPQLIISRLCQPHPASG